MSTVSDIKAPIEKEMKEFESYFRNSMKSKVSLLDIITHYILRRKGKQMRPMLVFLSAKLNGEINESSFVAATLIELLHTASLVHDDVVDNSHKRRGFFSLNAIWKNKISVLVGDYFLSKGLLIAVNNNRFDLLKIVSKAVQSMSEGELLQIEKARKLNITEEIYFEIIKGKTASLIASCTASGAKSVNASDEVVEQMRLLGENIGMAFQIKDDLFDYQKNNLTGKPSGNDLKEKKLTLPLIYALNNSTKSEKKKIYKIIKEKNKTNKDINHVIDFVTQKGGIEYSTKVMNNYKENALKILSEFPENITKKSIHKLIEYTSSRKK